MTDKSAAPPEHSVEYLRQVIRDLLLSADSSWEENHMGHDWADTVARARRAIGKAEPPPAAAEMTDAEAEAIITRNIESAHRADPEPQGAERGTGGEEGVPWETVLSELLEILGDIGSEREGKLAWTLLRKLHAAEERAEEAERPLEELRHERGFPESWNGDEIANGLREIIAGLTERARLAEQTMEGWSRGGYWRKGAEAARAEVERLQGERDEARAERNQEALDHRNTVQTAIETRERLRGELAGLRKAAGAIWKRLQDGTLVRDISHDGESDWVVRMVALVSEFEALRAALAPQEGAPKEGGGAK